MSIQSSGRSLVEADACLTMERRKSKRRLAECLVHYRCIQLKEITHGSRKVGKVIQAWCRNVSGNGMYLISPKPLHQDDTLAICVQIPENHRWIEIFAKVVWVERDISGSEQWRVGICFEAVDEADAEKLICFLTERMSHQQIF